MCRVSSVLVVVILTIIAETFGHDFEPKVFDRRPQGSNVQKFPMFDSNEEEYIRHIHSMINAYRSDMLGGRLVIETNALVDTKYKTWKRNADLINSLLTLPKGLNEAGR